MFPSLALYLFDDSDDDDYLEEDDDDEEEDDDAINVDPDDADKKDDDNPENIEKNDKPDEEPRPVVKNMSLMRRNLRYSSNPLSLPDEDFLKLIGLDKAIVMLLVESLKNDFKKPLKSRAIPISLKICAAVRFLATGNYQQGVGNESAFLALSQPVVSHALTEFLEVMEKKICPNWIKPEMTDAEKQNARTHFYRESELPGIIQAFDCTHVKIHNPGKDRNRAYRNEKGFYSLNVLLACDHELVFRSVEAKYPGSYKDGFIWNISALRQKMYEDFERGGRPRLVGDAAFPQNQIVLTPYQNAVAGSREQLYNQRHKEATRFIERAIGLLKSRFRCLLGTKELYYVPEKATTIVNACVALHNICRAYKAKDPPIEAMASETDTPECFYDGSEEVSTSIRDSIRDSLL
ncbi:putative nuclease HARBI1 [Anopheles aquasalis]|uniref:putative nuclease HARBI1 n=1 Tax=Anopheles aquasalis TaxID=42839 RepID=UPI00215B1A4A|nr:putative nuclease HARBI1 [Anopheles aquasalis]XP_050092309.1 putative nuclease HARBI1 [Anopheles aquasalis]